MYESEILKLINNSNRFVRPDEEKEIKELLAKNNYFYTFIKRLELLVHEKSATSQNEAKLILNFIKMLCKENEEMKNKLNKYLINYGNI